MTEPAAAQKLGPTPSQTVGPFLRIGLNWQDESSVVPTGTAGAVTIGGRLFDGEGEPIPDGIIETWQADPAGRFDHPDDPRGAADSGIPGFRGFGRSCTANDGSWFVTTVRPGPVPAADGTPQAPHLDVSVFARGMLNRVVTRIYFPEDTEAHAEDPVLRSLPPERRGTLVAAAVEGGYRFDIRLQGSGETPFFEL